MKSVAQALADFVFVSELSQALDRPPVGQATEVREYYVVQHRFAGDDWLDVQEFETADSAFDRVEELEGGSGLSWRVVRRWRA